MKRSIILGLAGAAGLVASCSFGPMWSTPEMPVPAEFRGAGVSDSTMADLPWQQVLNDTHLQALMNDVFAGNRRICTGCITETVNNGCECAVDTEEVFHSLAYPGNAVDLTVCASGVDGSITESNPAEEVLAFCFADTVVLDVAIAY